MGGESVGFQIVSDQGECLRSVVTGRANYEDEFYSVSLFLFRRGCMHVFFTISCVWRPQDVHMIVFVCLVFFSDVYIMATIKKVWLFICAAAANKYVSLEDIH